MSYQEWKENYEILALEANDCFGVRAKEYEKVAWLIYDLVERYPDFMIKYQEEKKS